MRIGTFNLLQFAVPGMYWYRVDDDATYSPAEWEEKCAWVTAQLAAMDADVIGFQEVFSPEALAELVAEAGYPHFVTVDDPRVEDEQSTVFAAPVVALASRHPVVQVEGVPVPDQVRADMGLGEGFKFGRVPVRAVVDIPGLGHMAVYVAHLKSPRSIVDAPMFEDGTAWPVRAGQTMAALASGRAAAERQRVVEAACLYHRVVQDMTLDGTMPLAVVGDFNDTETSMTLETLTARHADPYSIGGVWKGEWPGEVHGMIYDFRLADSYGLAPDETGRPRPWTHRYGETENVLDYVLVSNGLNQNAPDARAKVTKHAVFRMHVHADEVDNKLQSDHAPVVAEVTLNPGIEPFRFPGL